MPASSFPSVLFPAPFSPQSAWHEPEAIAKVTPSSATTPGKRLLTCRKLTIGRFDVADVADISDVADIAEICLRGRTAYLSFRYSSGTSAKPHCRSWRDHVPSDSLVTRTGSIDTISGTSFL